MSRNLDNQAQVRIRALKRAVARGERYVDPFASAQKSPKQAAPAVPLAKKPDAGAHLAMRLSDSFQRRQVAENAAKETTMTTNADPAAARKAWAKAFGRKAASAEPEKASGHANPVQAAWKAALARPRSESPATPQQAAGTAQIDRQSAWKKAMKRSSDL